MPKKSRFRWFVEKQHVKCAQTLLQFKGQLIYHVYWSLGRELPDKNSLLVICEISKLFPNTLGSDIKYSLLDRDNLVQWIQMFLSQKQKTFSQFFSSFLKSSINLERFRKKDDPHSWCISEIMDSQIMVSSMPKKSRFRGSAKKQHGKCSQTLFKFEGELLYHVYWPLGKKLPYKKSLLVICKILKIFLNTLSADRKYSLLDRDNLRQQVQI